MKFLTTEEARAKYPGVDIGAGSRIGSGVDIGAGSRIGSGVDVGAGVRIGPNCLITNTIGTHYHWSIYNDWRSGIPIKTLWYGCVTLPIVAWKEHLDDLLQKHGEQCRSELEAILNDH